MIAHGRKQISEMVYARKASEGGGAVRLTNMIRGGSVVFGGLEPDVKGWLEVATKAAILAAFGQTDGKAVIKATNRYLNVLAATDPTKAQALATLINYNADSAVGICQFFYVPELQAAADAGLLNVKQLADNSIFVQILHHHVKNGANLFRNATDAEYRIDTELFSVLKYTGTWLLNGKYEFLAEDYMTEGSDAHTDHRWSQTTDPYTNTTYSGFVNISNTPAGIINHYKAYGRETLLSYRTPSAPSNWFGAAGCYTLWNGGIPSFTDGLNTPLKGTMKLWIRVG